MMKTHTLNHTLTLCTLIIVSLLLSFDASSAPKKKNAKATFGAPDMSIAVDLNRDGKIEFSSTQAPLNEILTNPSITPTDKTYIEIDHETNNVKILPYRFWLNNNLDVVNEDGLIKWNEVNCDNYIVGPDSDGEYQQTCEQWDEDPSDHEGKTNTTSKQLSRIESYRDLEDFAPLKIRIDISEKSDEYEWVLKAVGINVNLFKGVWDDEVDNKAHDYIYNTIETKQQVNEANRLGNILLIDNVDKKIDKKMISNFFSLESTGHPDGIGHFIFEGVSRRADCTSIPKACYIAIIYKRVDDKKPLNEERVYLDLHDIEDYYEHITAGPSAESTSPKYSVTDDFGNPITIQNAFHASYTTRGVTTLPQPGLLNIYDGLFSPADIDKDYVLQIHGWRMRDSEKKSFSNTSFKRLYWSGYKGRMGALHWPTGWFDKPAFAYGPSVLPYVLGNERNYDISEAVARKVGVDLVGWLTANQSRNPNTHIIAHSMGNVVTSEALLNGGASYVTSFAAGQAATAAGSYDSAAVDVEHTLLVPGVVSCPVGYFVGNKYTNVEDVWRCYNLDSQPDTPFDMPPDMYRYDWVVYDSNDEPVRDLNGNYTIEHPETSSTSMGQNFVSPGQPLTHYFAGIGDNVNIVNFFNSDDAALTAWEFNQLTKPDYAQGKTWDYTNDYLVALKAYDACIQSPDTTTCGTEPPLPATVTSIFRLGGEDVPYNEDTKFDILAHAIPARTGALGQVITFGEIGSLENNESMSGFSNSNQDHSAPYHGYYSEISRKQNISTQQRAAYWNLVLDKTLRLDIQRNDLTKLSNGIGL
jgi:hypothetical protein